VLESSLSKGLVIKRVVDGQPNYRLGHFLGIWYEALMARQMRNDVDFALLFEEYMKDGAGGKILSSRPGGSRVVPVRGSLKPELLQSYDDIDAHFNRYERFGVVDCVCQIERSLVGHNCSRTLKRCGFTGLPPQTPLSENVLDREAALKLFTQLEDEGLVHTGFYGSIKGSKTPQFVGCCNCCDDCCAVLRGINEWNATEAVEKSNYRAVLNIENCLACGDCVERCQVHAIKQNEEGVAEMDRNRCIGCGLCVIKCPGEAIELVPVSKAEWIDYPASFEEWEERRLINLGKVK
jgi:electron transport complex protein RnfB